MIPQIKSKPLKQNSNTKIKAKTLKQLKVLKDNKPIDNKLYHYLTPTDLHMPRFYHQPKTTQVRGSYMFYSFIQWLPITQL